MPYFFIRSLAKTLLPSNNRGVFPRTEAGNALGLQRVHHAEHERIVRRHDSEIDPLFFGKGDDALDILCADIHADRIRGDPAVAGEGINDLHRRIFL